MSSAAPLWIHADALPWLADHRAAGSIITSLPDPEELGLDFIGWARWFRDALCLCIEACEPEAPAIFYQTDRKAHGMLFSKPAQIFEAARISGAHLLWHKIILRRGIGKVDLRRPGFCHLIAVSRKGKAGKALPDVLERGAVPHPNSIGIATAELACRFALRSGRRIIDPFCGSGTIPLVASALGAEAIGIDIEAEQIEAAKALRLDLSQLEPGPC